MKMKSKYFCTLCYDLYDENDARKSDFRCPKCKNASAEEYLMPIDEPIADIIQMMNQKGYITQFSCAGHRDPEDSNDSLSIPYIIFKPISLEIAPALLSENKPLGFDLTISRDPSNDKEYQFSLRLKSDITDNLYDESFTDEQYNESIEPVFECSRKFLRVWAKWLPNLNN